MRRSWLSSAKNIWSSAVNVAVKAVVRKPSQSGVLLEEQGITCSVSERTVAPFATLDAE